MGKKKKIKLEYRLLSAIPDNYVDFYPLAREMKRRFVLHIGPTNSGKTYQAIEALKKAGNGVYLAPLRLLAYEQYDAINRDEIPCSMLTGEERIDIDDAQITASTIEMANYSKYYSVAVIDEAQMIADPMRGGSWTSAILGILAEEIHVCASQNAEGLLIKLIRDCGDEYSVVYHERKTPLKLDRFSFEFPRDVEKGDALIVFSRRNVHAVASELHEKGYKCSIIYGALPYDVRHTQAELFASGINDVVVATDAIGMGMNLPIHRIVFLEQQKFDGIEKRELRSDEIKQIAGRAGRYGIYDEGIVTSFGGRKQIRYGLEDVDISLRRAVIDFPESLIGIDAPLSLILEKWISIPVQVGYEKALSERELKLCRMLENQTHDKEFIYRCITIPFDEEDSKLLKMWLQMCQAEMKGQGYAVRMNIPRIEERSLDVLEQQYRICDLLYMYCDRFDRRRRVPDITRTKARLSEEIVKLLSQQKLQQRKCRFCGKPLPWNFSYSMCEDCYDRRYGWEGYRRGKYTKNS